MNVSRTLAAAFVAGGALFALVPFVGADGGPGIDATQLPVSRQQAVDIALAATPGTVAGSELKVEDGLTLREIEIIDGDGREIDVEIDVHTDEVPAHQVDGDDHDDARNESTEGPGRRSTADPAPLPNGAPADPHHRLGARCHRHGQVPTGRPSLARIIHEPSRESREAARSTS